MPLNNARERRDMDYRIIVSKGRFDTVEMAACTERKIDWWNDTDLDSICCTECYAAVELKKYITGFCGAAVQITDADCFVTHEFPSDSDSILLFMGNIGTNICLHKLEQRIGRCLSADLRVGPEGFRLCGFLHEGLHGAVLSGSDRVGTLYAAYAYLERLGLRFISPGPDGVCRHPAYDLSSEQIFDEVRNPDFTTRGAYSEYVTDDSLDFVEWMAHNRFNYTNIKIKNYHLLEKLGVRISGGGHEIFYRFMDVAQPYPYRHAIFGGDGLPADPYPVSAEYRGDENGDGVLSYGEAHPEWYALVDGKRRMKRDYEAFVKQGYPTGDNICTTNPYAVAELVRLMVDDLIGGEWKYIDYLDLWPLDNGKWCECEACAADGNYSYKLLMLAYTLDRALKAAYAGGRLKRRIKIIVPIYHETLPAPDRPLPADFDYSSCFITFFPIERCYVHDFDDPACEETNRFLYDRYLPWTKDANGHYKGEILMGEYYNVSSFAAMPFVLTKRILHDLPYYYRTGTRHFHYMHITARSWGFSAINNFLYARLLRDIHADPAALCREYFDMRYGPLADEMTRVYTELEAASANCKYLKHYQVVNGKITSLMGLLQKDTDALFPLRHMRYDGQTGSPEEGPSLVNTLTLFEQNARALDAVLLLREACEIPFASRLAEDARQLDYGLCMLRFLHALVRFKMLASKNESLAAGAFDRVMLYGEQLRALTEPLAGYDRKIFFKSGLEASWLLKYYDGLITKYHPETSAQSAQLGVQIIG